MYISLMFPTILQQPTKQFLGTYSWPSKSLNMHIIAHLYASLSCLHWCWHCFFFKVFHHALDNCIVFSRSFIASGFPWFGLFRSANCRRSQQKWGWAFGSSRPESLLFRCYVFCFEETALVSPRNGNASTKSEAPQPHQLNFFWDLV